VRRLFLIVSVFSLLSFSGCDWISQAFFNSIPFHGNEAKNPEVHVFLAIDGLSYQSVHEAQKRGYFSSPEWKLSKFISMFPATSDASWTRILQTEPLPGYEYTYFDPKKNEIQNKGYAGLVKHVIPTVVDGLSLEAPYLKAFDYRANGYTHAIGVYHDIFSNLAESLDNLFFLLEGRAETKDTFSGYLMEIDAMGHIFSPEDVQESLRILERRIRDFQSKHHERKFKFTIFSDHGLDFVRVKPENLIRLSEHMPKVGVTPVETLKGHDPGKEVFAVAIDHVRLTYLSLHTVPSLVEEVAKRLSRLPFVDISIGKLSTENWYGAWENGKQILAFSFDPKTNQYLLPDAWDYSRFGLEIESRPADSHLSFTDEELFQKMKNTPYPDLFHRIRTGLSPVGLKFPGDVLLSFKPGYAAIGFELPGGNKEFSLAGFHGSLRELGSLGALLTNSMDLPDAVRSDNMLTLFPKLRENIRQKK
jgi:hypothetical protein